MPVQSLVWTALPNGYTPDGASLRLSVLLSPRLDPQAAAQRLDSFPEWLDWPATMAQARFAIACNGVTVTVAGAGPAGPNRLDTRLGAPDSTVWRALFTPALFVRPYAFADLAGKTVISYDVTAVAALVKQVYGTLAAQADGAMPVLSTFLGNRTWTSLAANVAQLDAPAVGGGPRLGSSTLETLKAFQAFHTPLAAPVTRSEQRTDDPRIHATWTERNCSALPQPADLAPAIDFHQIVSAMASYPKLMRLLGLVVDILVAPGAFPDGGDVPLSVAVSFPAGVLGTTKTADAAPVTRTRLGASVFEAVSDPAAAYPLTGRLLDLDPARFSLLQVDADAAGLKLMNFLRTLRRRDITASIVDPVTRQAEPAGAPSLRSVGLMLVQRQRATWLAARFQANKVGNAALQQQIAGGAGSLDLHAEDLVRGYRVDIWDATTRRWASLCRRTAHYELGESPVVVEPAPEEESTIRLAATASADPTSNADAISVHEALLTWNGWSLAAPPPGRNIRPDDAVDTSADQSEADTPPGMPFSSRFKPVRHSLPRLRFGRSYWLRARAVDLAGNALDFREGDFGGEDAAANAVPYLRFEPLAAPVLALVTDGSPVVPPGPGESIARMAIRSFNDSPADNGVPSAEQAQRAAVPPQVSVREAEQHGALDKAGRVDAGTFTMLANDRDLDGSDSRAVIREVRLAAEAPAGGTPVETTFAVYTLGRAMTYLPDPLARAVAVRFFGHPGIDPATVIRIPLYPDGAWPDARPFTVAVIEDASAAPFFDPGSRQLRVPLPKAVRAVMRLSMTLDDSALALMGVLAWLDAAAQAAQTERARDGQHWMLTPWRELELVHAVQRPLLVPDIAAISVLPRKLGETSARPMILVQCSVASTDRLELRSVAHEPVDDGATPSDLTRNDMAFQVKVTDAASYATVLDGNDDGGFPEHTQAGPDLLGINALTDARVVVKAHEFHDTRYRRIAYWFDATTRFREYLPAALLNEPGPSGPVATDRNIKVSGKQSVTWVPNAAPPPAPTVLYVLPSFTWTRDQDDAGNAVSQRRGGLRVYLGRPWNASGYGEMLGVVLPPAGFSGDPETAPLGHPLKNVVTQWAADPIWASTALPGLAPQRSDFPLARLAPDAQGGWLPPGAPASEADQPPSDFAVTGMPAPDPAAGVTLDVAPHDVAWSAERQLWFCDIALDPGAVYFPFIRLALARYQPVSTVGAHLSSIVLADFVALTPSRWLSVGPGADARSRQVTVSGHGYTLSSSALEAGRNPGSAAVSPVSIVEIWVEQLDPRLGEDFGWLRVAAAQVTPGPIPAPAADPAEVLWSGQVSVPENASGLGPYRLVVAEYEEHLVDDDSPYQPPATRKGRRLVFVEHHQLGL